MECQKVDRAYFLRTSRFRHHSTPLVGGLTFFLVPVGEKNQSRGMDESDTTGPIPKKKQRAPIWVSFLCLLSFVGMMAVLVEQFVDLFPWLERAGWAVFFGVQLLLVLNAMFRKKRSDIMGEFHAQNMISWLVFVMLGIGLLLLAGLYLWVSAKYSGQEFAISDMYGLLRWLGIIFCVCISYGLLQWSVKKR